MAIVTMTIALILFVLVRKLKLNSIHFEKSDSFFIAETSGWYFYLVLSTFYGGALTSYFASKSAIPFTSLSDVINAYPGKN